MEDDHKQRRFQMREMKENLWKWRGRKPGKMEETKQPAQTDLEEKLRIVEEMLAMSRKEKEGRLLRADEKRETLKSKLDEKKIMEDDKKIKKETKKRLEASWSTMGWATNLLSNNKKIWENEENDRRGEEKKELEEWRKMTRLDKVAELQKKYNLPISSNQNHRTKLKKRRTLPAWMMELSVQQPVAGPELLQPGATMGLSGTQHQLPSQSVSETAVGEPSPSQPEREHKHHSQAPGME